MIPVYDIPEWDDYEMEPDGSRVFRLDERVVLLIMPDGEVFHE